MTTLAWDGSTLASDRQATDGRGLATSTTKILRLMDGTLIGWCGPVENGLRLAQWYQGGAKESDWPESQKGDDWATLVVVLSADMVFEFEQLAVAQKVEDERMAWGTGKLAALAAMECGMSAAKAVEIAARFDIYTGCGVNVERAKT